MPPVISVEQPPALYAPAVSTQSSGSSLALMFGSTLVAASQSITDLAKRELLERVHCAARESETEVAADVLHYSLLFAQLLPSSAPVADVLVDDDGEVAFDWGTSARSTFTVSVGRGGLLRFAGLFNGRTRHGSDQLTSTIPSELLAHVSAATAVEPVTAV